MERLTAFEFISATDAPQLVRLKDRASDTVLIQLAIMGWGGWNAELYPLMLERREDLVIEGQGLGRPYWNGEQAAWTRFFDPAAEAQRIGTIRAMVQREINRASLSLV